MWLSCSLIVIQWKSSVADLFLWGSDSDAKPSKFALSSFRQTRQNTANTTLILCWSGLIAFTSVAICSRLPWAAARDGPTAVWLFRSHQWSRTPSKQTQTNSTSGNKHFRAQFDSAKQGWCEPKWAAESLCNTLFFRIKHHSTLFSFVSVEAGVPKNDQVNFCWWTSAWFDNYIYTHSLGFYVLVWGEKRK